ncbi:MAG: ATP-dependent DNA ligase, partial [Desulforhopalus sp.]
IVAFKGKVTSFSKLQPRINVVHPDQDLIKAVPVYLYLFDLLHLDGFDVSRLELRARKSLLKKALSFTQPRLRFCPHINERGVDYYHDACRKGWEGIIAKDAAKPYSHGRSNDWLKFKCVSRQELVIGGFTEPRGKRRSESVSCSARLPLAS